MIPVTPVPEPAAFDSKVRQPGLRAIAELAGEQPDPPRTAGRPYARVAASRDAIPAAKFPPYWRKMLDDLMRSYYGTVKFVLVPQDSSGPKINVRIWTENEEPPPEEHLNPVTQWDWKIATLPPKIRYVELQEESLKDAIMEVLNG